MNNCQEIYLAAGSPTMPGRTAGRCRTCGEDGVGESFTRWVKDTFNDHNLLQPGEIVCHACLFSFSDSVPSLAARVGKEKPQRMRNYSHFVLGGEWLPLSKSDKRRMAETLLAGPEVAVVAISGQKHIIFRGKPGWWQIEEECVLPFPQKLREVLALVETLYNGGFNKSEIESGRYSPGRILAFGLEQFMSVEGALVHHRGTMPFQLGVFLAQRSDADDDGAISRLRGGVPAGAEPAGSPVEGDSGGVQTEIRPEHMGPIQRQSEGSRIHIEPVTVRQPSLFPDADSD